MQRITGTMTIGERIAFHRRRRGMSQEVLAGLVGRTADWLRKVEHDRVPLDRLSVIRQLARVLNVSLGELLAEPRPSNPDPASDTVSTLRAALIDHRPRPARHPPSIDDLERDLAAGWAHYQQSHYAQLGRSLPRLVTDAHIACGRQRLGSHLGRRAHWAAASSHQLAAAFLTKLGHGDLACLASATGRSLAHLCEDPVLIGSLDRSVAHSLMSMGEHRQAVATVHTALDRLEPGVSRGGDAYLSVYGMLHLAGAVAAARVHDRAQTTAFLAEADTTAQRLGRDSNHLWTAFGPTNVAIHRVTTAFDLGDLQIATDLGPRIDTTAVPTERRIRHAIETARAFAARNRIDTALDTLLTAERSAPEQVRHHRLSRLLISDILTRPRPPATAVDLATRMGLHHTDTHSGP